LPCLLAHARPALPPPSPSPLLIVSCSRDTRILFLVISFPFVSPFCGSTKRIGPFVLPQKGRTVPSLFLFFISPQIFGRSCCGHLLERFLWTGLLRDLATGVGSGFITNFDRSSHGFVQPRAKCLPDALPPSRHGQDGGSSAVPDGEGPHLSGHGPGGTDGSSRRQRLQSRRLRRKWAKRNAATADSFLR